MTGGKGLPGMRRRDDFRLSVLAPGAPPQSRTLDPGSYVIGADRTADIVVMADADGDFVRLDLSYHNGTSHLEAVAIAAGVVIDDEPAEPGEMRKSTALMTIMIAGTRITISGRDEPKSEQPVESLPASADVTGDPMIPVETPAPSSAASNGRNLPALTTQDSKSDKPASPFSLANPNLRRAALLLGLSLIAATGASFLSGDDAGTKQSGTGQPAPIVDLSGNTSDAAAELRRLIKLADLQERIVVTDTGARVEAKGFIGGSETRRWHDILQKAREKTRVVIDNRVRLAPGEAVIGRLIAGIVTDPIRHVVDRNGAHFRPGDTMPDGWTIVDISTSTVVLSKDGAEERLDY